MGLIYIILFALVIIQAIERTINNIAYKQVYKKKKQPAKPKKYYAGEVVRLKN